MDDMTDIGIKNEIKELEKSTNQLQDELTVFLILQFFMSESNEIKIPLSNEYEKHLIQIKKIYKLGMSFKTNQLKKRKKIPFLNDTKEGCLQELERIRFLYSERTYFRYKKMFKEMFPD